MRVDTLVYRRADGDRAIVNQLWGCSGYSIRQYGKFQRVPYVMSLGNNLPLIKENLEQWGFVLVKTILEQ